MHELIERLVAAAPVITDGAWGTQMQALGLASGANPDEWNLTHPDRVRQVAARYVDAGSRVILTNTFRSNRLALEQAGLADKVQALNRAGVELSRQAADGRAAVFASIGPSGKMLFAGQVTEQELAEVFAQQARALAEAGAEALVIETMADLAEAKVALAAAKQTRLPVVACMVFDTGRDKDRTMTGVVPEQAAEELTAAGADVIGANCGQGVPGYVPICQRLRASTDRPIWVKPNAGQPEIEQGRIVYRTTPEQFADGARQLIQAGASFVGGCCGTSPDFIAALAALKQAGEDRR